jgi:predicted secreted hydrolase
MARLICLSALLVLVTALLSMAVYALTRSEPRREIQAGLTALKSPADTEFARVLGPKELSFPADHGPHPDYRIEWWYFSGNLDSARGRHFGYELALFRIGLSRQHPERQSRWGASQLYMGHLAVTDVSKNRFHAFERISRGALDLAGSSLDEGRTFRVWLEDWSVLGEGSETPTVRLTAAQDDVAIGLDLVGARPLVLQGDRGFSQKSASPGNASYYYSSSRMSTSGTLMVAGQSFGVSGDSWMDHEWSTSALSEDQEGWDWFPLQLSDGRDLMVYQLRNIGGGVDPFSSGTVISEDGTARRLSAEDVEIRVLDTWESPHGGRYPIKWRMDLPLDGIEVEIVPYVKNQELDVSVRYWEGAVELSGTSNGRPIKGSGYVEMTGYAGASGGRS